MVQLTDLTFGAAGAGGPGATPEALTAARELAARAEAADGTPPVSDQAMLAVANGQRTLLLFGDAAAPGAEPIALGIIGEGELDLVVQPEARGRGVGRAALIALLARHELGPGPLRAWAHGENPAATSLLERAGFAPVRSLYRMGLDPHLLPGDARDPLRLAPGGLALHTFGQGANDAADWVRVNAAAFATHPEQGRMTEEDLALLRQEPWFDAGDLILLSDAHGDVIGSTWLKTVRDAASGAVDTELYALAVHPESAGRRLGRLLLDVTLARMAQHSPRTVTLYVDGDNARAVRLYETAGFTIDSRSRQWEAGGHAAADARMGA
ncbi:mycothiol synthase [Leucobacter chromiireducens]|uniref:mycothiol synthase n=1 Tax=Leucobacter chromiireducens TaxID=283877 RepID=UPI000F64511A|nr:mycothiol synthase [Leucobacter chromiireducens]